MHAISRLALAVAGMAAAVASPAGAAPTTLRDIRGVQPAAVDPGRAALVIIDAQNEYADGPLKLEGLAPAMTEIRALRDWAAMRNVPVIHIRQESLAGAAVFAVGSRGADFLPGAAPAPGEAVVRKVYPNAFNHTDLDARLKALGRDQLILTGFMAHMCVESTARAGFDLDYKVFVVASATADRAIPGPGGDVVSAEAMRQGALTALNDRFAWIIPSAATLDAMTR